MLSRLALACVVAIGFLSTRASAAPPAPVPQTGQVTCYEGTRIGLCRGTGQDGDTRRGVAWPVPRFTENPDQTLTDHLTGLIWTRDADAAGRSLAWQQALDSIQTLNRQRYLGHGDWRLPNVSEVESLVNKQPDLAEWLGDQGFTGVHDDYYWTSSTYAAFPSHAWSIGVYSGNVAGRAKGDAAYVWPVRGDGPGPASPPRTGQTVCFNGRGTPIDCANSGQDGELQKGVAWPAPRLSDNGDQTLTDRLTGLVWSRESASPGPSRCNPSAPRSWQKGLDYVRCLNESGFLGHRDWRLPNRNELASLVNRGEPNAAAWLHAQGFANVRPASYWSSSTYPYNAWNAWSVNFHDGAVTSMAKQHGLQVWPVRGAP